MAYNSTDPRVEYTSTAGQTIFTFLFKIYETSDLNVYLTPVGSTADDTTDILTLTTDYTVTINGDNGGSITLVAPGTSGDAVTIVRSLPADRDTEYQTNGDLLAATLNDDQDYQTYLIADSKSDLDNVLKIDDSVQGVNTKIPVPEGDAYLRWNSDGDALTNSQGLENQLLGNGSIKGIQYMAQTSTATDSIVVEAGLNAFSVDSFTLLDGATLTVENTSTYKVL